MNSKTIVNDNPQTCQETPTSPYDAELSPVRFDVRKWHKDGSGVNLGYVNAISMAIDRIQSVCEPKNSIDDDFLPCPECHFASPRHASDCMAAAASDFELLGKQHLLVQGLKCQNGCDEYATEKSLGILIDGHPVTLLVCEACAFGGL